jgi:F0F1-type ATP synthase epsilon subunit
VPDELTFTLRTPHEVTFEGPVSSVRVGTETGQAGVRPRGEPLLTVVEPGLILLRSHGQARLAACAGGLLEFDGRRCTVYTPFAAVGEERALLSALERALSTPDSELAARRRLGELEQRILQELTSRRRVPRARRDDAEG